MSNAVGDYVLDNGLAAIDTLADRIYICSYEPASFTEATSTYALGYESWAAGGACGSPATGSPNGRKVVTTTITEGDITATGQATKWAVVDFVNSRLLAHGTLSPVQNVTSGNKFQLGAITIRLPSSA